VITAREMDILISPTAKISLNPSNAGCAMPKEK
jgi:hypothetical protein